MVPFPAQKLEHLRLLVSVDFFTERSPQIHLDEGSRKWTLRA